MARSHDIRQLICVKRGVYTYTNLRADPPENMPSPNRQRRYWGMTTGQIGLLAAVAAINGVILLAGLLLVLSPQEPDPALAAVSRPSTEVPAPTSTAPARFPPTWTPTPVPTSRPTRTPLPTATAATRVPRPTVERPNIAIWNDLNSYRLQLNMRFGANSDAQSMTWKITYEWVKEPAAEHTILTIDSQGLPTNVPALTVESIQIGNAAWTRLGGDWQKTAAQPASAMQSSWADVEELFRGLKPVGEDTINGLRCQHYVVDDTVSGSDGLGAAQAQVRAQGEVWIAAQPDLPPVPVRVRLKIRAADLFSLLPTGSIPARQPAAQADVTYDIELDVTDINRPITIRPPL